MTTILKHTLQRQRINELLVPLGAQIVSVQEQHGALVAWVMAKHDMPLVQLRLHSYHTAEVIPPGLQYVATVQLHDGHTVIHLFKE